MSSLIPPFRFLAIRLILIAIGSTATTPQPYGYLSGVPAQNFIQVMPVGGTSAVNIQLAGSPNNGTPLLVNRAGTLAYTAYGWLDTTFPPLRSACSTK